MKIAYEAASFRLVPFLCEMGHELFPYDGVTPCDAVLYESDTLPACVPAHRSAFYVHTGGKTAAQTAEILQRRTYTPFL